MPNPHSATAPSWDYRHALAAELRDRQARNPLYSLRAFARSLGVSRTALSDVISGRRDFSMKNALRAASRLPLTPGQTAKMIEQLGGKEPPESVTYQSLSEDQFRLVADWHHFAILSLARVPECRAEAAWIARRLGISRREASDALERLLRLGFVRRARGQLKRVSRPLHSPTEVPSEAIRKHHRQNLQLAEKSLDRDPIGLRDFNTITMPLDPEILPEAKRRLLQFKRRFSEFARASRPRRVYTLSLQLFPVDIEETTA
jgi:DNA-binding MarR family transcriptional regulator